MNVDERRPAHEEGDSSADEPLGPLGPPEVEPPEDLRADVVARLRAEGLLSGSPASVAGPARFLSGPARHPSGPARFLSRMRGPLAAAALVLAFVVGRASAPGAEGAAFHAPDDAWVLLLYEDARFDPRGMTAEELVAAYSSWVADARDAGVLVLGEKLADTHVELRADAVARRPVGIDDASMGALTGLFIVRAPDEAAALGVARETPHHRLGGTVVVRAIDPT